MSRNKESNGKCLCDCCGDECYEPEMHDMVNMDLDNHRKIKVCDFCLQDYGSLEHVKGKSKACLKVNGQKFYEIYRGCKYPLFKSKALKSSLYAVVNDYENGNIRCYNREGKPNILTDHMQKTINEVHENDDIIRVFAVVCHSDISYDSNSIQKVYLYYNNFENGPDDSGIKGDYFYVPAYMEGPEIKTGYAAIRATENGLIMDQLDVVQKRINYGPA
jgi:hypothetical protein